MKIRNIEIHEVSLPFRFAFKHAAAARTLSESLFAKVTLEDGTVGWGESLPRAYVTGETVASAYRAAMDQLMPLLIGQDMAHPHDVLALAGKLAGHVLEGEKAGVLYYGAARCVLEIALLDAAARHWGVPITEWLDDTVRRNVYATAVVPGISGKWLNAFLCAMKLTGFRAVKVKVGTPGDEQRLKTVRGILGKKIPLILDANGAWRANEAIENLKRWRDFNIAVVEQPVPARDFIGLKKVREETGLSVMADESLRSLQDAEELIGAQACNMFNVRLSKCGGLISSWKIWKLALASGVRCQLGCQVGESGVLAAAGRAFAMCAPELQYYEGGYGPYLLRNDPATPSLRFGWAGKVHECRDARGLGVTIQRLPIGQ